MLSNLKIREEYTAPPVGIKVSLGGFGESSPFMCFFCLSTDLLLDSQKHAARQKNKQAFEKENCCETSGVDNIWYWGGLSLGDITV